MEKQIKSSNWLIKGYTEQELAEIKEKAIKEAEAELRDKQIEEMAKDLGDTWVVDLEGNPHDLSEVLMRCDIENISEQMHEIGYRRASEVARKIFAEIEKSLYHLETPIGKYLVINRSILAQLQKKYESEGGE